MPYKDPEKRREYDRKYQEANRERLAAYRRNYRELNREEIAENRGREIRFHTTNGNMYFGISGMTRKQRLKFQQELMNGTTDRP